MAALETLLLTLPEAAKARGDAFERLTKWYLENSPTYGALIKTVWRWEDWPGRWGRDAGIDLVAETHDGEFWAVQAKAYAPTTTITKSDVDTFLSESARDVFRFRLLIATTDQIGHNARQVFGGQAIPASLRLLGDLAAEPIEWPASFDDLRAPARPRATPRPHQVEALDAIERRLSGGGRGRVIMACGTGKTFVQLWAHERLKSPRTLVLVPSLFLVQQSLHEWTANRTRPFEFLAVCSDDTVMPDGFVSDVTELGLPVTTDPVVIRHFLEGSGDRVIFSTYQSSGQIAEALRGTGMRFDLVLADEAHRLAGQGSRDFASALRDEAIPADRRIFFTATPRYLTGKTRGRGDESDLEVVSMDDEAVFGPEIHRLSFGEAIRRELLSDYRVVVVGVSDRDALRLAEQGAFVTFEGKLTDAQSLAREIGLAKAMHDFSLRRVISFHSRVKAAEDFSEALRELIPRLPVAQSPQGELVFDHVSGGMPTGDRRRLISRLRDVSAGQYALLANARCLSEGVDVPSIDGVAFVDPRRSQVDIVQAVGRAIRLSPDKTLGTIVIPVLVPEGEDEQQVLSDSAFEPVWAVVRALRDYDEELAEQLDAARRKLGLDGRLTEADLPPKLIVDLPMGTIGRGFIDAFTTRVVQRSTSSWEEGFAHLEAFVVREGHARVATSFKTPDGYPVGQWVTTQRTNRAQMSSARASRLEALSGWTWDVLEAQWEEGFARLGAFIERNHDGRVPPSATIDGYRLGAWVKKQRANRAVMSVDRQSRLQALPKWTWDPLEAKWTEGFAHLERYVELECSPRVPQGFKTREGYPLGSWVAAQRRFHKRAELGADRVSRLEGLPRWTWTAHEERWDENFALLEEFATSEGHERLPDSFKTADGYSLRVWVNNQRRLYVKGQVSNDRISRLEALPGWAWDSRADRWEDGFAHLEAFVTRKRRARVPRSFETADGYRLGPWVDQQRLLHGKGQLGEDRVSRLIALQGWTWDPHADQWEEGFDHLVAYVADTGDALVPSGFKAPDGFRLGGWAKRQRSTRDEMIRGRVPRLESLAGWTWDPYAEQWDRGFAHLRAYVADTGDARAPDSFIAADGYRLGQWVGLQRAQHVKGALSADRTARMEALNGWVWRAR